MVNTILGLEIVRFHAHYYIRRHQYNGSFTSLRVLSEQIIARIPRNRNKYKKWLRSMRTEYRAKELALEKHVHQICDESKPDYSKFAEFVALPSELPRLDEHCDAKFFYIINLDKGILTMNHTIHWSLCNIPHQSDLWARAIEDSTCWDKLTVYLDTCSQERAYDLPGFGDSQPK